MPWLTDNRQNKKLAREQVFSCNPKKSVLLLPGYRCACAKYALNHGIITEDTICTFVERDIETVCQIRQWVKDKWTFPIPPIVHHGELSEFVMHPIDLAYIDLFGNLTKSDFGWVKNQLVHNLMPGCDLAFTFSVPIRSNEFIKQALLTMNVKHTELFNIKLNNFEKIEKQETKQVAALYDIIFEQFLMDFKYEANFWTYKDQGPYTMLLMMFKNINKNPELLLKKYKNEYIS